MDRAWTSQLRKGLTELTVLAALRDAGDGEAYGYQLLQRLARTELLASTPATLYPVLARLADERKIAVREAASPAGPPRRYYRLTAAGQTQLAEMTKYWEQLSHVIDAMLSPPVSAENPIPIKEPSDDAR